MKRFLILLSILFCTTVFAHTIEWYVDGTLLSTTTCESGDDITPPTVPAKYGYHFRKWAEYQPIEYLESTGTQYIDTGFKPTNKTVVEIDYQFTQLARSGTSYQIGAGSDNNSTRFRFIIGSNGNVMECSLGTNVRFSGINALNRHILKIDAINRTCSIDNTLENQINNYFGGSDRTFYIFNLNNGTSVYKHYARCFYLKIYDNGILVRDFIPVLDSSGTPCMFDKVEKKFYYNQGTGQFIAGPVITE
jgi:hypothetical protein